MDPELGMGIEFLTQTVQHRHRLEELIRQMTASPDAIAEVLVEPEAVVGGHIRYYGVPGNGAAPDRPLVASRTNLSSLSPALS